MVRSVTQLKTIRTRFGWVLAISLGILVISILFIALPSSTSPLPQAGQPSNLAVLISLASLATSVTSLVGFFFTTGLAWRKERREKQQSDLDLEKKRLEVESLRLELEHKKQEDSPKTEKPNNVA